MKCPKCGKEIANDSMFCEYCGTVMRNDDQRIKKVDVRWCLLPAMTIATIAMGFAAESWDILLYGGYDHNVQPFFVIPLCLFIVSCWYGIKKIVPPSFVIMILILFGMNCKILYDSVNTRDYYKYVVTILWSNDYDIYEMGNGGISLYTGYNDGIKNGEKAREELLSCALALEKKLKGEGKEIDRNIEDDSISKEMISYTGWKGIDTFILTLFFFLIYSIYVVLAHKRTWNF